MNKQKQAFTLVELIVVITILAILGTIAIMAFGGYSKNARDSRRMSDLNNITKVLELFKLQSGNYPDPTDTFAVTYSGSTAWTQGSFGDQTVTNVGKMDKKPTDPLTESEYTYSVTNTRGEFQVAAIYEGDNLSANGLISQTYAAETLKTIVKGTYNGKFVKTNTGSTTYILGAPSIITSEITSVDIETIANNKSFVYTNYSNLPSSYKSTPYTMTGGFDFGGGAGIVLFEGNLLDLGTSTGKLEFANNLNAFYSVDPLGSNIDYKEIVEVDTVGNPAGSINLVNNYLSNKVGGVVASLSSTDTLPSTECNYQQADLDVLNAYGIAQQSSVFDRLVSFITPEVFAMGPPPPLSIYDENYSSYEFPLTKEQWCTIRIVNWHGGNIILPEIFTLNLIYDLYLADNGITDIPAEISNLTHIKNLGLGGNNLTSLPSEVLNLLTLESLSVISNQFTALPAQIGNLVNLVNLDASYNQLTSIPTQIGNLANLITFTIEGNQVTSIPSQIGSLSNLYSLDMSSNQISALPSTIGSLSSLGYLDVESNLLTTYPNELISLVNLEGLDATNNIGLGTLSNYFTIGNGLDRSQSGIPTVGKTMRIRSNGTKLVISVTP